MHLWCLCSSYSARSRVRGHLEIYHAYIRDGSNGSMGEPAEEASDERDWEFLNNYQTEHPAQVKSIY